MGEREGRRKEAGVRVQLAVSESEVIEKMLGFCMPRSRRYNNHLPGLHSQSEMTGGA